VKLKTVFIQHNIKHLFWLFSSKPLKIAKHSLPQVFSLKLQV